MYVGRYPYLLNGLSWILKQLSEKLWNKYTKQYHTKLFKKWDFLPNKFCNDMLVKEKIYFFVTSTKSYTLIVCERRCTNEYEILPMLKELKRLSKVAPRSN